MIGFIFNFFLIFNTLIMYLSIENKENIVNYFTFLVICKIFFFKKKIIYLYNN